MLRNPCAGPCQRHLDCIQRILIFWHVQQRSHCASTCSRLLVHLFLKPTKRTVPLTENKWHMDIGDAKQAVCSVLLLLAHPPIVVVLRQKIRTMLGLVERRLECS